MCQHPTDNGTIQWQINGTAALLGYVSEEGFKKIEGRGEATEALLIRAIPQYNETEVVCIFYIIELNGTHSVDRSTPATLTVQGTIVTSSYGMYYYKHIIVCKDSLTD